MTVSSERRFLISGVVMLAVAMGIGRFAYTPLLPLMQRDAGLSVSSAGSLAFSNLLGYLAGASVAMVPVTHRRRIVISRWAIAGVIVSTGLMSTNSVFWLPLRFFTGVASGLVLVFVSSIVLERAARQRRHSWPPLLFAGVGIGIAFSGVAVPIFAVLGGSRAAWIGIACCAAIASGLTFRWLVDVAPASALVAPAAAVHLPRHRFAFRYLVAVYTAEAFAYIVPATFLVALASRAGASAAGAAYSWIVVGLAAAFATFPWIHAAARLGKARALALALAIQGAGIVVPALFGGIAALLVAALALGSTFMAITLFAAGIARDVFPRQTTTAIGGLTVFYSVGQMAGPLIATQLALRFGSYNISFLCAGATAAIAAVVTLLAIHEPRVIPGEKYALQSA